MQNLNESQIHIVLQKVKDEPDFRDWLTRDPAAALTSISMPWDQDDMPDATKGETVLLPADDSIETQLDLLTSKVFGSLGHVHALLQVGDL
jgi:hypothetical protein